MAAAWAMLPSIAASLNAEDVEARVIAEIISEELRAMTGVAATLAEKAMLAEGRGAPPCSYAILVLGSGGRGESLLAADQDNAIIFAYGDPGGTEDTWFAELGARVADTLDVAGIPYCRGGVMARNAEWRGSFETWTGRVADWVRRSRPEDLLNVDIFYDMVRVHGDATLAHRLTDYAWDAAKAFPPFAKLLGAHIGRVESPFGLFGGLKTADGRLDLKLHGLFPIVATARTLALRHGVRARSTRERLEGLIALDIGGDRDMEALIAGHGLLIRLLLAQQSRDLECGVRVSNRVELAELKREEREELKDVLGRIRSAPELVRDLMFG